MESVRLTTSDGHELAADLQRAVGDRRGSAVLCHPHPQYGGNRFNPIVDAVFRHLPTLGFDALRFDFRSSFGEGVGERRDVIAALDHLNDAVGGPTVVVGYSFGATVALNAADERITAIVAIAPPLTMMTVDPPTCPTLVLAPQHDQFTPIEVARSTVDGWPQAQLQVIESVDHLLAGRAASVAQAAGEWLVTQHAS